MFAGGFIELSALSVRPRRTMFVGMRLKRLARFMGLRIHTRPLSGRIAIPYSLDNEIFTIPYGRNDGRVSLYGFRSMTKGSEVSMIPIPCWNSCEMTTYCCIF